MQGTKKSMQQCMLFINDAKSEIESIGKMIGNQDQTVKTDIDQAYHSLNDSWSHCNTALQRMK